MTDIEIMSEIRDANLNYLMLAQKMIREDKAMAIFRLGVSTEIAEILYDLSNSQLIKLASSPMMLARFRFDDGAVLGMLSDYNKDRMLSNAQAVLLMAGQAVQEIA